MNVEPTVNPSMEKRYLTELHRGLTLGGSSWILGGSAVFLPYGIVFLLLIVAAIAFSPYMLWRLYKCGRKGWLAGFAVTVLVPAALALVLSPGGLSGYLLGATPLITFYIYTWILRLSVSEWLDNLKWQHPA